MAGTTNLPLFGTKTHPLTAHAIGVLRRLSREPIESYQINPGVRDRLTREDLAQETKGFDGKPRYSITDAGRAALAKAGAP